MIYLLYTVHVIVSIFLILVVLLQQGKGADLSVFGGGSTQTAFGARGAATVLHKLTVVCFVGFILTTLGIAVMKTSNTGSSVIDDGAPIEASVDESTVDEATEGEDAAATSDGASTAEPSPAEPSPAATDPTDAGDGDATVPPEAGAEPADGDAGEGG